MALTCRAELALAKKERDVIAQHVTALSVQMKRCLSDLEDLNAVDVADEIIEVHP